MIRPVHLLVLALTLLVAIGTAAADKKQYRYVGIHPIPKSMGGGICHIQFPHVHIYPAMDAKVEFRDHDGWQYFAGDPVAYGWDGPKYAYYGHHPIPVGVVVGDDREDTEYCYIDGPHYHAWAPPPALQLELRGGAYWYVGDFPQAYVDARPVYDPIDLVYAPMVYDRPAIEVSVAPPHWYGAVVVAPAAVVVPPPVFIPPGHGGVPPGHVRGGVGVGVFVPAPSLQLELGVPTVQIGIGGGVIVRERGHGHGRGRDDDDDRREHRRGHGHHDD